jgi:plastocyanin
MNATKTLALGAMLSLSVALASCGGSSYNANPMSPTTTPPSTSNPVTAADVTITITGMNGSLSFSPNPGPVKVGQTVAWRNGDSVTHTATADGGSFDTGNIAPGATSSPIKVSAAGAFSYHCAIHPTMVGSLSVTQ